MACSPPDWHVHTRSDPVPDVPSIIIDPELYERPIRPANWVIRGAVGASAAALCVLVTTAYMRVSAGAPEEPAQPLAPLAYHAEPDDEMELAGAEIDVPTPEVVEMPPEAPAPIAPDLGHEVREGHRARRRGHLDEALSHYKTALTVRSTHAPALAGAARVHVLRRQKEEALKFAERAVNAAPRSGAFHLVLGDALKLNRRMKDAERAYRRADALGNKLAASRLLASIPDNPY